MLVLCYIFRQWLYPRSPFSPAICHLIRVNSFIRYINRTRKRIRQGPTRIRRRSHRAHDEYRKSSVSVERILVKRLYPSTYIHFPQRQAFREMTNSCHTVWYIYFLYTTLIETVRSGNAIRQTNYLQSRTFPEHMYLNFSHMFREVDRRKRCTLLYLQPIITQYFIDNKSEIWLLFLIAHSKR